MDWWMHFLNRCFRTGPDNTVQYCCLFRLSIALKSADWWHRGLALSASALCALHCMRTTAIFIVVPVSDYRVLKCIGIWSNRGIFEHILWVQELDLAVWRQNEIMLQLLSQPLGWLVKFWRDKTLCTRTLAVQTLSTWRKRHEIKAVWRSQFNRTCFRILQPWTQVEHLLQEEHLWAPHGEHGAHYSQ